MGAVASGDDLAVEADLHFQIGLDAYSHGEFRSALEHFLASNRLVTNRNVVFSIARTFEQLRQFPDAHRYYTLALDLEQNNTPRPNQLAQIREALQRIRTQVALMRVETSPPGATVYINRRDLGARGVTPAAMAFDPNHYRVLVELEGYEPAEVPDVEIAVGRETPVHIDLVRIVGTVRVEGAAAGADVRVDEPDGPVAGHVPCELQVPPGRHRVFVSQNGFQTSEQTAQVEANQVTTLQPRLEPLTGTLMVNTDERDALVEVDGQPVGFTPSVQNIAAGQRHVRISLSGYRTIEQDITLRPNETVRLAPELRQLQEVEAASRVAEAVEDAPGSVTVITGEEIRAMGYPNLVEAVRGVRGIFVSDDRFYPSIGVRGFSRLGDFGNRVLVLLNGVSIIDNWGFNSFFGYDFMTDLGDVERIEVIRGPGSVLYGTGAVSGVINVVTRGRNVANSVSVGASVVENNIARARASITRRLGADAGVWTSIAAATSPGRDFDFPELRRPATMTDPGFDGRSVNADGFQSGTVQGRAWYRALSAQWFLTTRTKAFPFGLAGAELNNAQTYNSDTRGLFELRFEPRLSQSVQLYTRAVLNHYNYIGNSAYPAEDGIATTGRERFVGTWANLEARVQINPAPWLRLMVGVEGQLHFQAEQRGQYFLSGCTATNADNCAPSMYLPRGSTFVPDLYDQHPFQIVAGYVSADWMPTQAVHLSVGLRQDLYLFADRNFTATSPRVALILRPYANGNLKILGGRAFRAPSIYEQYYNDGGQTSVSSTYTPPGQPQRSLTSETAWSGEVEFSHRFSTTWTGTIAAYANYYDNFIVYGTVPNPKPTGADLGQYQNSASVPVLTLGAEVELRREWRQGWMFSATYSFQRSQYLETEDTRTLRLVANYPDHLASVRGAMPIIGRLLTLGTRLSFETGRWDRHESIDDPLPQLKTDPALIWDVVVSGQEQRAGLRYSLGLYNALDWRYSLPVSDLFPATMRSISQNGRTVMLNVGLTF